MSNNKKEPYEARKKRLLVRWRCVKQYAESYFLILHGLQENVNRDDRLVGVIGRGRQYSTHVFFKSSCIAEHSTNCVIPYPYLLWKSLTLILKVLNF